MHRNYRGFNLMRQPQPPEFYQKFARLFGVGLIIIGIVIVYFFIYTPIQQAKQHVAEIILWKKMIGVSVVCVVFGLTLLITNDRLLVIMRNRHNPEYKKKYYMVMIPMAVIGVAAFLIITSYLDGLGYTEKSDRIENEQLAPASESN